MQKRLVSRTIDMRSAQIQPIKPKIPRISKVFKTTDDTDHET